MNRLNKIIALSSLLLVFLNKGGTQDSLAYDQSIGSWKNYIPFTVGKSISQSAEKVFYTTEVAVLVIDKENPEVDKTSISKLNGLNGSNPNFIKYIPQNESLIVTYQDSNFDQVFQNQTESFNNLQRDGNFFNREILNMQLLKDSLIYFSMAFGIVEFNPLSGDFGFTLDLGIPVLSTGWLNGYYYAGTEEGIYRAIDDPAVNLKDETNWKLLSVDEGFPAIYRGGELTAFNDAMYVTVDDTLYQYKNEQLTYLYGEENHSTLYLTTEGSHLLAGFSCNKLQGDNFVSCDGAVFLIDENGIVQEMNEGCINRPRHGIEDENGTVWTSDSWGDFRAMSIASNNCKKYTFNSPVSTQVNEIALRGDEIWLSTNGVSSTTLKPDGNAEGIYTYIDGVWDFHKRETDAVLNEQGGIGFYRIAVSPDNEKFYVGTHVNGLVEVNPGPTFNYFSKNNSDLQEGVISGTVRVAGLAFDPEGNLWLTNNNASRPMACLKPDGTLINNFDPLLSQYVDLRDVVVDFQGYKWFTVDKKGLVIYDDNGTIDTNSDDRFVNLVSTNSNIPEDNFTRCLEVDLDGEVWVGTSKGVISFDCGPSIFDLECSGVRQIVEVDGILANLLETEDVWSMAVDGANRKWFGTTSGAFLMSPNGKEQLAFFDVENSPLPDNFVTDIKVHPTTGEVFFATGKGLVSYREGATIGESFHLESNVYAFPNPVAPDYEGAIAIKGLTRDADVKITDINGQLVYETTALGGQAVWNGKDYNGRKAASGVYLVFSTSENNDLGKPNTLVTKVLFMN